MRLQFALRKLTHWYTDRYTQIADTSEGALAQFYQRSQPSHIHGAEDFISIRR